LEPEKVELTSVIVVVTFSILLHGSFIYDALVWWGYIGGPTISESTHRMLIDKPGVALLLGYLVCHLVKG
jgi:hypothetical protein